MPKSFAMEISQQSFALILCAAAALIALWVVVRFWAVGPRTLGKAFLNVLVAHIGGAVLAGYSIGFLAGLPISGAFELAVVAGALPPCVYLFVSIAWFIRSLQGLMPIR